MDYLDVIVHIFTPEAREFYRLEQLWGEAPKRRRIATGRPSGGLLVEPGGRTPDLDCQSALSQLSYSPENRSRRVAYRDFWLFGRCSRR